MIRKKQKKYYLQEIINQNLYSKKINEGMINNSLKEIKDVLEKYLEAIDLKYHKAFYIIQQYQASKEGFEGIFEVL